MSSEEQKYNVQQEKNPQKYYNQDVLGDRLFSCAGAHFSKAPETFWACKALFSPSLSKTGEVYTAESSCMRGAFLHVKNI